MPLSAIHKKVQTSKTSAYRRQQQHTFRHCQLGHVIPGHAILVAVCLFMLPMLEVAAENKQLISTHHTNPADLCGSHVTFGDSPLVLPSLDKVLPAMVLQNRVVNSNMHLSCSLSYLSIHQHVSLSMGLSVPSSLKKVVMVVVLLLLLSGDIETNPGPIGKKLTSDDLGCVYEEVLDVCSQWYDLGLQLKLRIGTLDRIYAQFRGDPSDQLRETLKMWLTTSDNPSWRTLTGALRSQSVGAAQLAGDLETKYCPVEGTDVSREVLTQKATTEGTSRALAPPAVVTSESPTTSAAKQNEGPSLPPSESSKKLPFGCGCGKCTFFSFIESGCPTPIPSASSFPYLNLSGLTHEQQQELRGRLWSESRDIMMQFQELVSATIKSFKRRCVPLDELVSHVMALGAFDPVFKEPQVSVFHHYFEELKAADTIPKVFLILNDYFSFFNYHIIEHIIKELGTEKDKAELQRYKEDFNQYARRRIYESLPEFGPISEADHADIFVKVDSHYEKYTVAEIEGCRHKLSKILRVSSQGILRLCRVDKGCSQMMFQVPSFVQHQIFPLSKEQEKALETLYVIRLTCGKYQFLKNEPSQGEFEKKLSDAAGMGLSLSIDRKSTTFSEVLDPPHPVLFDHTFPPLNKDHLKKEMKELGKELKVHEYVERAFFHNLLAQQTEIFSREQRNPLSVASVTRLKCGDYQFLKCDPLCTRVERELQQESDVDSGMGSSISTDTKSTTFSEDHLSRELNELDYELRVEGLVETLSHKSGSGLQLHLAVAIGQLEFVRLLVEKEQCDPMQRDRNGITAFHMAAIKGNVQVFKYFITECNCNPACPAPLGLTPLHLASHGGHIDLVKYLIIEQQIDPLCEDDYGNTPLHRACAGGCQAVVEFLTSELIIYNPITQLMIDLKNKWSNTPLHSAIAGKGHLGILQFFISDQNCDPNIPGQCRGTLLHCAAQFGHLHIVRYLIDEQGCNPSCLDENKLTPLHHAAMMGHIDVVKFLAVEHGDPMSRDFDQNTPLHVAALRGHIEVVKFLTLEMHCDPTSRNADNDTALHLAVMKGHMDIVQFFISDQSCDANIPGGQYGWTPLHYAAALGNLHIVKYLTDEQACNPIHFDNMKYTPLHFAAMNGNIEIVKFFITKKDCDQMCRDSMQNTPLHISGPYGRTPLHYAAEFGHLNIVKYLIDEQGCNPLFLDEDKYTPLHLAAKNGHMNIVKFLTVEKHCDPTHRESDEDTPLHMAALGGHIDVVKFFIVEMHCDPISRTSDNYTALHLAVSEGHLNLVQFFISDQNCEPNIPGGHYHETPLHYAAAFGHLHIVKYLTDKQGCNPSCLDENKCIPLHYAAINGHVDIVKFLTLEKHCDPMYRGFYQNTPLHMASMCGHIEVVKFLTAEMHCDPMCISQDSNQDTPLHRAAMEGHIEVVKFLTLEMHCDATSRNAYNSTALHLAVVEGHLNITRFFISDQDCDPNIPGGQCGRTPLHYAAEYGHLHIVKYLTEERGCNPSCLDKHKYTPLHCAAMKGRMNIVKFLTVEKHCYPMCRNSYLDTPLHMATLYGHLEVVKFLTLEMHCNPTSRNSDNDTALHLAAEKGHLHILELIISDQNCDPYIPGQSSGTPLHYAAKFGHLHIVKYLIDEQGCNLSCQDEYKYTPLHLAAMDGHLDIVKFLIVEKHCNLTDRDIHNAVALHLAVRERHLDIVRFFISDCNCDPNIPGPHGRTSLHIAAEYGHLHIVKYLTDEQGCNPSYLDEDKCTPLHCAASKGHTDIVKFLIEEKHCDPMCRSSDQLTPLHAAAQHGHIEIVKFLTVEMHCDPISRDADNYAPLHLAVGKGHLNILQFFISDLNCDPNVLGGESGGTPLHYAAVYGHLNIVKYLIDEQGCNPSCLNKHEYTPLHCAAAQGHMDIVKFLTVERHCDLSQNVILHCAVLGGNLDIVKFLVEELKCPVDITGPHNKTPLKLAESMNRSDIAQYLQEHSVMPYIYTAIAVVKHTAISMQGSPFHHQVEYTYQIPGDEASADKQQLEIDASGSTYELYLSAPSQNTQRQVPHVLEKLMLPENLTLARIKDLEFDRSGGKYYSPEDGYSLTVPRGAIPKKLGLISIQCGVIPYGPFGPFKYPDGIKPVSPIVWFCSTSSVEFQRPVEINIPHCLDCDSEEDSQSLAFFKANHIVSDSSPGIFHFKEAEGVSSFPPNTSHGTLRSKHLCFYCIGSKDKEITNRANFCLIMAEPKCFQRISRIHFCLTYLLKTCIQAVEEQFADADYDITVRNVKFQSTTGDDDQAIEIEFESHLPYGWSITRKSGRKIWAREVYFWDNEQSELELMHRKKTYPPRFTLDVHGENATHNAVALVEFQGACQDLSTEIYLSLPTAATNSQQQQPYHPPCGQFTREGQDVPKPTIQQLMEELYNTVASKWKSIGTLLDITGEELSTISQREHGDPQECLVATLRAWLHQTNPPASWRKIANAVDFIGKPDIAQQIRQKYCKHAST